MPIKFRCPHCEQFLGISESKAGSIADCPTCGHSIRVPNLDGTVGPLPAPRLNLQDEGLLSALGELASLQQGKVDVVVEPPHPLPTQPPMPLSPIESLAVVPPPVEIVVERDAPVRPVAHIEDPDEPPATAGEVLSELIRQSDSGPPAVTPRNPVHHSPFSHRAWLGIIAAAFVCGILLGLALRGSPRPLHATASATAPQADPPQAPPKGLPEHAPVQQGPRKTAITGNVTYSDTTGTLQPDRGARILLLPLTRTGTTKLTGLALRVGADPQDRKLLQATAEAMGGAFETADEQGHYQLSAPAGGRYGLLIVSQHQSRARGTPLTDGCRSFLANCFERPDLAVGDVDYSFAEVTLESDQPLTQNVAFQGR